MRKRTRFYLIFDAVWTHKVYNYKQMTKEEAKEILINHKFRSGNVVYKFLENTIQQNGQPICLYKLIEKDNQLLISETVLYANNDLQLNITEKGGIVTLIISPVIEGDKGFSQLILTSFN